MKFSKFLKRHRYEEFKDKYLKYDYLRSKLNKNNFLTLIDGEIKRVYNFVNSKIDEIDKNMDKSIISQIKINEIKKILKILKKKELKLKLKEDKELKVKEDKDLKVKEDKDLKVKEDKDLKHAEYKDLNDSGVEEIGFIKEKDILTTTDTNVISSSNFNNSNNSNNFNNFNTSSNIYFPVTHPFLINKSLIMKLKNLKKITSSEIAILSSEVSKIATFIKINSVGFKRLIKDFDKINKTEFIKEYRIKLKFHLNKIPEIEKLIYKTSQLMLLKRKLKHQNIKERENKMMKNEEEKSEKNNENIPNLKDNLKNNKESGSKDNLKDNLICKGDFNIINKNEFVRKTNKYWVHRENIIPLKCQILKNLPQFIYSEESKSKTIEEIENKRKDIKDSFNNPNSYNSINPKINNSNKSNVNNSNKSNSFNSISKNQIPYITRNSPTDELKKLLLNSTYNYESHLKNSTISSVYFDNEKFDIYNTRLKKLHNSECIRIRWYSVNIPDHVFIERKKHSDGWTGYESKKMRFKIPERVVNDYINGKNVWKEVERINIRKANKNKEKDKNKDKNEEKDNSYANYKNEKYELYKLYTEIQESIVKKNLRPVVRTFYRRTAFQYPEYNYDKHINNFNDHNSNNRNINNQNIHNNNINSNIANINSNFDNINSKFDNINSNNSYIDTFPRQNIRISLDTDLCMIKESTDYALKKNPTRPIRWRREDVDCDYPFSYLNKNEIVRFPYAILEIKTQKNDPLSNEKWLEEIINSHLVEHVNKFSKFMHGMALLYPEIQDIPYWVPQLNAEIRKEEFYKEEFYKEDNNLNQINQLNQVNNLNQRNNSKKLNQLNQADKFNQRNMINQLNNNHITADQYINDQIIFDQKGFRIGRGYFKNYQHHDHEDLKQQVINQTYDDSSSFTDENEYENDGYNINQYKDNFDKDGYDCYYKDVKDNQFKENQFNDNNQFKDDQYCIRDNENLINNNNDINNNYNNSYKNNPIDDEYYELSSLNKTVTLSSKNSVLPIDPASKRIVIPVRVEPKVFFANERTFLSWLNFSIFIGGIGTAMMELGDKRAMVSGIWFIAVSVLFSIYALYLYVWRANKIRERDPGPYDDMFGPVVLVVVFLSAMVVSVAFRFPLKNIRGYR